MGTVLQLLPADLWFISSYIKLTSILCMCCTELCKFVEKESIGNPTHSIVHSSIQYGFMHSVPVALC
ncbi:hypothetical protein CUMW_058400 [Citrus unshiu]|nr:hypothetical protein CUMW_058400 [Citrus unshiu]